MSETCPKCGSSFIEKRIVQNINHNPPHDITYRHESVCGACYHVFQTFFDHITQSQEVLAPLLVREYWMADGPHIVKMWVSKIVPDHKYKTEAEAIAATLARLKEVYNGN